MLSVAEIWRYPVKSMGGERVASAAVGELGIAGDRGWGLYEATGQTVLTARRAPELLFASARLISADLGTGGAEVAISLPDGGVVSSADPAADERLSAWLGRPVQLRAAGDDGGTYEVPLDFENDADWVSWQGPGGAWHDSAKSRLSLVSRDTLGDWDPQRFRTNVILDGSGEDALVGSSVAVGSTVQLDITKRIDRCVIVTRPLPGGERDLDVLRTINRERESCLAVGALVASPGTITEGDRLTS